MRKAAERESIMGYHEHDTGIPSRPSCILNLCMCLYCEEREREGLEIAEKIMILN